MTKVCAHVHGKRSGYKFVAGSEMKCKNLNYDAERRWDFKARQFANTLEVLQVSSRACKFSRCGTCVSPEACCKKGRISFWGGGRRGHLWNTPVDGTRVSKYVHKVTHQAASLHWRDGTEPNLLFCCRTSSGGWCHFLRTLSMFHWTGLRIHISSAERARGCRTCYGAYLVSYAVDARTHRVPHDDVDVWAEGVVDVLRYVEVNKVTEVVVHVHPWREENAHTLAAVSHIHMHI